MSKILAILAVACVLVSCNRHDSANEPAKQASKQEQKAEAEKPEPVSVTSWTEKTELFMEYPPLVAGQSARFAVHFTAMGPSFKAVRAGSVNVVLERQGKEQTFTANAPSRPGIFGVDVKPDSAGTFSMTVRLRSSNLSDSHSLGSLAVHPDAASASAEKPGKAQEETIAF